ncbi:MoaD/ThiS family protein [Methylibium sp.]|uniref:MoaD/ThiS family protein n=1 Tax=Methylibium sp. TaxID=2067992 RepID=UPI003D0E091A
MKVQVRYFASVREALGPGETMELETGARLSDLRDRLIARGGHHADALGRGRALRMAMNHAMVGDETQTVGEGAEIAFFPPVTGG